jgi:hypothetical protein
LVKRNGKEDPLKKTLIIIDEAHKLFSEETPLNERPNIDSLKKAIYKSYSYSKKESCRLLLMTATPYTNDPLQLFKLINLLKEDDYLNDNFQEFAEEYLDLNYKFTKTGIKQFLDKISGYISYLNRERDIRQFAYPVIYTRDVDMSVNDNIYELFFDDIKDYLLTSVIKTKEIINNLKKIKIIKLQSQETAINDCLKIKKNETNTNFITIMETLIKEQEDYMLSIDNKLKNLNESILRRENELKMLESKLRKFSP